MHSRLPYLMVNKDPDLTQRQLAKDLKLSHTTINKLYNGRPMTSRIDPDVVEKVCGYFNCEVGDLFELKETANA